MRVINLRGDFSAAFANLYAQKMRTLLTALGIVGPFPANPLPARPRVLKYEFALALALALALAATASIVGGA